MRSKKHGGSCIAVIPIYIGPDCEFTMMVLHKPFHFDLSKYNVLNEEEAEFFLAEDEYTAFDNLDAEDEQEIGISLSSIDIPEGDTEEDLAKKMYVKNSVNNLKIG